MYTKLAQTLHDAARVWRQQLPAVGFLRAAWAAGEEADWWVRSAEDMDFTDRGLAEGDDAPGICSVDCCFP